MDEQEAIELLHLGDLSGFEPLVKEHYTKAVRTAYLFGCSLEQAEDLVQTAFVNAAGDIKSLGAGKFEPWFFRRVVMDALVFLEKNPPQHKQQASLSPQDQLMLDWFLGSQSITQEQARKLYLRQNLWRVAQSLSYRQRAAVVMQHTLDMSPEEIDSIFSQVDAVKANKRTASSRKSPSPQTYKPAPHAAPSDQPPTPTTGADAQSAFRKEILTKVAEAEVPASRDPWKAVEGKIMVLDAARKTSPVKKTLRRIYVYGSLLMILAGFIYIMTRPGRQAVQVIFDYVFKTNQQQNMQSEPFTNPIAPPTAVPTATQVPPMSAPTQVPDASEPTASTSSGMTLEFSYGDDGESLPFQLVNLDRVPVGYQMEQLYIDSGTASITRIYSYTPQQAGETFVLTQTLEVPIAAFASSAAVENFTINGTYVEAVQGAWFAHPGLEEGRQLPAAVVRSYRWQKDGYFFCLTFFMGDETSPAYLDVDMHLLLVSILLGAA